jgi:preprotein translocase subunit YajC
VFISSAYAQTAGSGPGGDTTQLILMVVGMIAFMYFIVLRPQMKRQKEQRTMMEALQKGDEIITTGGMLGRVNKVTDAYIAIEIAPNTEVQIQKSAVQTLLPKGTLKGL